MSSSPVFSPDNHHHHHHSSPPSELCYVQCKLCDTVLAVSVPYSSLYTTVTVRCGHCTQYLSVNMRALHLPVVSAAAAVAGNTAANQFHLGHNFFYPQNLILEEMRNMPSNLLMNQPNPNEHFAPVRVDELPKPPVANRPPEKRQRVPSAYNRFIKEEIQRIKAGNPDISHREAFSAAAKNWAHFPHIHFGLMHDQPLKKPNVCQQEGEDLLMKDGFLAAANVGERERERERERVERAKVREKKMSSSPVFSPDNHHHHHHSSPPSELCYVQCKLCDTVLAVSVPYSSLYTTVTVRCGHCTQYLSVNMRALHLPVVSAAAAVAGNTAANQFHLGHNFFYPQNLILEEMRNMPSNLLMNQPNPNEHFAPVRVDELPKPPVANRPPEKRQRVPSAYNRFIKEEIQRIKAGNPDISHREAFSAAAKNWAHFPHIHFGLMHDQPLKKPNVCQQEGEDLLMKDGFLAAANVGVSPF
ncbi:hypothetical protein SSX86_027349 [Deinandra increscens subsp. villosa]|uniref:Uncharacterized protein n=1 Tax=Deinandra increscens subsp. villosa TaxID=3103831 RepID=A0AAP0CN53_9ASTR